MLVQNAQYQGRIKVPEDVERIQKGIDELHNLLTGLVKLFVDVEKKAMEYESLRNPREMLGPNFNHEEEVKGRENVFACRVIVEESLNMLHDLVRVLSEPPVEEATSDYS